MLPFLFGGINPIRPKFVAQIFPARLPCFLLRR